VRQQDEISQEVPQAVLAIVTTLRRIRKRISLVHLLLVVVVLLTVAVASLSVQRDSGKKPAATPTTGTPIAAKPVPVPADGVDITKYCAYLGFASGSFGPPSASAPYCVVPITLDEFRMMCREQYGSDTTEFRFKKPDDANTGECVDASGAARGGLQLQKHCATKLATWPQGARTVRSSGDTAGWECRVDVDASVICAAGSGTLSIVAKQDGENLVCAPRPNPSVTTSTGR
jgi:hypothetical protein